MVTSNTETTSHNGIVALTKAIGVLALLAHKNDGASAAKRLFELIDEDNSGELDLAEMAALAAIQMEICEIVSGSRSPVTAAQAEAKAKEMFQLADTSDDGRIDRSEWTVWFNANIANASLPTPPFQDLCTIMNFPANSWHRIVDALNRNAITIMHGEEVITKASFIETLCMSEPPLLEEIPKAHPARNSEWPHQRIASLIYDIAIQDLEQGGALTPSGVYAAIAVFCHPFDAEDASAAIFDHIVSESGDHRSGTDGLRRDTVLHSHSSEVILRLKRGGDTTSSRAFILLELESILAAAFGAAAAGKGSGDDDRITKEKFLDWLNKLTTRVEPALPGARPPGLVRIREILGLRSGDFIRVEQEIHDHTEEDEVNHVDIIKKKHFIDAVLRVTQQSGVADEEWPKRNLLEMVVYKKAKLHDSDASETDHIETISAMCAVAVFAHPIDGDAAARAIFHHLDLDGSNGLDFHEMEIFVRLIFRIMQSNAYDASAATSALAEADTDGDHTVSEDEFAKWFINNVSNAEERVDPRLAAVVELKRATKACEMMMTMGSRFVVGMSFIRISDKLNDTITLAHKLNIANEPTLDAAVAMKITMDKKRNAERKENRFKDHIADSRRRSIRAAAQADLEKARRVEADAKAAAAAKAEKKAAAKKASRVKADAKAAAAAKAKKKSEKANDEGKAAMKADAAKAVATDATSVESDELKKLTASKKLIAAVLHALTAAVEEGNLVSIEAAINASFGIGIGHDDPALVAAVHAEEALLVDELTAAVRATDTSRVERALLLAEKAELGTCPAIVDALEFMKGDARELLATDALVSALNAAARNGNRRCTGSSNRRNIAGLEAAIDAAIKHGVAHDHPALIEAVDAEERLIVAELNAAVHVNDLARVQSALKAANKAEVPSCAAIINAGAFCTAQLPAVLPHRSRPLHTTVELQPMQRQQLAEAKEVVAKLQRTGASSGQVHQAMLVQCAVAAATVVRLQREHAPAAQVASASAVARQMRKDFQLPAAKDSPERPHRSRPLRTTASYEGGKGGRRRGRKREQPRRKREMQKQQLADAKTQHHGRFVPNKNAPLRSTRGLFAKIADARAADSAAVSAVAANAAAAAVSRQQQQEAKDAAKQQQMLAVRHADVAQSSALRLEKSFDEFEKMGYAYHEECYARVATALSVHLIIPLARLEIIGHAERGVWLTVCLHPGNFWGEPSAAELMERMSAHLANPDSDVCKHFKLLRTRTVHDCSEVIEIKQQSADVTKTKIRLRLQSFVQHIRANITSFNALLKTLLATEDGGTDDQVTRTEFSMRLARILGAPPHNMTVVQKSTIDSIFYAADVSSTATRRNASDWLSVAELTCALITMFDPAQAMLAERNQAQMMFDVLSNSGLLRLAEFTVAYDAILIVNKRIHSAKYLSILTMIISGEEAAAEFAAEGHRLIALGSVHEFKGFSEAQFTAWFDRVHSLHQRNDRVVTQQARTSAERALAVLEKEGASNEAIANATEAVAQTRMYQRKLDKVAQQLAKMQKLAVPSPSEVLHSEVLQRAQREHLALAEKALATLKEECAPNEAIAAATAVVRHMRLRFGLDEDAEELVSGNSCGGEEALESYAHGAEVAQPVVQQQPASTANLSPFASAATSPSRNANESLYFPGTPIRARPAAPLSTPFALWTPSSESHRGDTERTNSPVLLGVDDYYKAAAMEAQIIAPHRPLSWWRHKVVASDLELASNVYESTWRERQKLNVWLDCATDSKRAARDGTSGVPPPVGGGEPVETLLRQLDFWLNVVDAGPEPCAQGTDAKMHLEAHHLLLTQRIVDTRRVTCSIRETIGVLWEKVDAVFAQNPLHN